MTKLTLFRLQDYFKVLKPTDKSLNMYHAVVLGMTPWRPDEITSWIDYDIDFGQYRVTIDACGRGWQMAYTFRVGVEDMDVDGNWLTKRLDEIVQAFRTRENWPVPDNIELGEN